MTTPSTVEYTSTVPYRYAIGQIPVACIRARHPRTTPDELMSDIGTSGVLKPLALRYDGWVFLVQHGLKRFAAARELGLGTIPAVVQFAPASPWPDPLPAITRCGVEDWLAAVID